MFKRFHQSKPCATLISYLVFTFFGPKSATTCAAPLTVVLRQMCSELKSLNRRTPNSFFLINSTVKLTVYECESLIPSHDANLAEPPGYGLFETLYGKAQFHFLKCWWCCYYASVMLPTASRTARTVEWINNKPAQHNLSSGLISSPHSFPPQYHQHHHNPAGMTLLNNAICSHHHGKWVRLPRSVMFLLLSFSYMYVGMGDPES